MQPTIKKFLIAVTLLIALCVTAVPTTAWAGGAPASSQSPQQQTSQTTQVVIAATGPAAEGLRQLRISIIDGLCWLCGPFNVFYNAAIYLGYEFSKTISTSLVNLLAVVFGLWLLWILLKIFMPFGQSGPGEVFNAIVSKLALFVFLLAFLTGVGGGYGNIWNWFISPIFNTGIELSTAMMRTANNLVDSGSDVGRVVSARINPNVLCPAGSQTRFELIDRLPNDAFGDSKADIKKTAQNLTCMISNTQQVLGVGAIFGLAQALTAGLDVSVKAASSTSQLFQGIKQAVWGAFTSNPLSTGQGLVNTVSGAQGAATVVGSLFDGSIYYVIYQFVMGLFVFLVFVIAIILFPLYIIDAIFRFAVIAAISPILVGAFLFPVTRNMSTTALKQLMSVAATLFFQSLIIALAIAIMVAAGDSSQLMNTGSGRANFLDTLANNQAAIQSMVIAYLAAGILVLFMIGRASKLASEFTGAATEIGSAIGSKLASQGLVLGATAAAAAVTGGAALAVAAKGGAAAAAAKGAGAAGAEGAGGLGTGGDGGPASSPPGDLPPITYGFKTAPPPVRSTQAGGTGSTPAPSSFKTPISSEMADLVAAERGETPQSTIPTPDSALASPAFAGYKPSVPNFAPASAPSAASGALSAASKASASPFGTSISGSGLGGASGPLYDSPSAGMATPSATPVSASSQNVAPSGGETSTLRDAYEVGGKVGSAVSRLDQAMGNDGGIAPGADAEQRRKAQEAADAQAKQQQGIARAIEGLAGEAKDPKKT